MTLSIVIPAYNEERDIEQTIEDVVNYFPEEEIVVVNDASTDQTLEKLQKLQLIVHNLKVYTNKENRGHGYSVIYGLWQATGDYILYIDADRQISLDNLRIDDMEYFIYDIVSGQRKARKDKLFRKITSIGLRYTILLRHRMYIKDSNCPFKLYKRESIRKLIRQLPDTLVIPVACLEVLARRENMRTKIIETKHQAYNGKREGFLQLPNKQFFQFVWRAFNEVIRL